MFLVNKIIRRGGGGGAGGTPDTMGIIFRYFISTQTQKMKQHLFYLLLVSFSDSQNFLAFFSSFQTGGGGGGGGQE